jgi:hypothetical protein
MGYEIIIYVENKDEINPTLRQIINSIEDGSEGGHTSTSKWTLEEV